MQTFLKALVVISLFAGTSVSVVSALARPAQQPAFVASISGTTVLVSR